MSNIALVSPATGTATFSITTPSGTSTDRTLTLPDNSGTVANSGISGVDSVPVGRGAGNVSTNTAVGAGALAANTTGDNITAVGSGAYALGTASANDAFGQNSMGGGIVTGVSNAAFGRNSLNALTSGTLNTAIGSASLEANTTGSNNTAVGRQALTSNTTASNNTAVGYQAAYSTTTAGANIAIGYQALYSNTTGQLNVAIGSQALYAQTADAYNTAVGGNSMQSTTTGNENAALGRLSLNANTTGSDNTAVGYSALSANTTASNNTAVGFGAGSNVTTGSNNTYLGYNATASVAAPTGEIVIGYGVAGIGGNYKVTIGSSGVGRISADYSTSATWTFSSDINKKQNIQSDTLGLSFINRLRTVTYQWKPNNELPTTFSDYAEENVKDTETVMHGLVAQEVKAALDAEGVTTFEGWGEAGDGSQVVSREMFIIPLIKAIQELNAKVDAQAAEIATLKGQA
jgi:hypothetical protein